MQRWRISQKLSRLLVLLLALPALCCIAAAPVQAQTEPARLIIQEGVVVKFGPGSGLHVRARLQTAAGAVLTAQHDDSVLGPLDSSSAKPPEADDWLGLLVDTAVPAAWLRIDGLGIRWAGGTLGLPGHVEGGAALVLGSAPYSLERLELLNNTVGIRLVGNGSATIGQARLHGNGIGLLAEQGATPTISASSIAGNTAFGIRNTRPAALVQAQGNWWGHASGPYDGAGNPAGLGDAVSPGVDYGSPLAEAPALACTIAPTAGYTTRSRTIELRLHCPQAARYRVGETPDAFDALPWLDMAGSPTLLLHTLSPAAGEKPLYVQFQSAQGQVSRFGLSQPIIFAPAGPLVQWLQPAADAVLDAEATLAVSIDDPGGVRDVEFLVDGQRLGVVSAAPYTIAWPLALVPPGSHTLAATATNLAGVANTATRRVTVARQGGGPPAAPVITAPLDGASVGSATVQVSGAAAAASQVQLYLDGRPLGDPVAASANAAFSASITLPAEGSYQLTATASNARGTSPSSDSVAVHYQLPIPGVAFAAPAENARLTAAGAVPVTVTASAPSGIAQVRLFANDQPIGTLTQPPYTASWPIGGLPAGDYTLRAEVTSGNGREGSATRTVRLQAAGPSAPPPAPYSALVQSISPQRSFGQTPVTITGQAIAAGQPLPNAMLRLLLQVDGFQRRINLASDAAGTFSYQFTPQGGDNGLYQVAVQHPDETGFTPQGQFSIERLGFSPSGYQLSAARGIPAPISISAHASAGATGVRWVPEPQRQSGGRLPPGISVDTGAPIDVPAGGSAPSIIRVTAASSAASESGSIVLTAYANESGTQPRGSFTIAYQLGDARPDLYAQPALLQTGVRQGQSVSEQITIGNRGLVAAQNVRVRLVNAQGQAAPPWLFLASSAALGVVDVGGQVPLQITASPGPEVADGIYNYRLLVDADNQGQGSIPVSVAVTQSGAGAVVFSVSDLFTDTLDAQGRRIEGVQGARIRVQNEAVPTQIHTLATDASGRAELAGIAPGTYLYRASGPRHADQSGRVFVRAGISIREHIHLGYQSVSVQFGVTETSIPDHYDIVLEATYQSQVPAPVVLLEPLAVNLPELQVGEEFAGELTLTNYGLIAARNVRLAAPPGDEYYRYELLGEVPETLPAQTRIAIAYRVTALKLHPKSVGFSKTSTDGWVGELQKNIATLFSAKASSCAGYSAHVGITFAWECANGQEEQGAASSTFSRLSGSACAAQGQGHLYNPRGPGGAGGGWGGGSWGGGNAPMPLAPGCTPHCAGKCCTYAGAGG